MSLLAASFLLLLILTASKGGSADSMNFDAMHTKVSEIEDESSVLLPINISAIHLVRFLHRFLSRDPRTLPTIENEVTSHLFSSFSILPHLSEASYFGEDGLFITYQSGANKTFALFSNTTFSSSPPNPTQIPKGYSWYQQEVDHITGIRRGKAVERNSVTYWNSSWFRNALESQDDTCSWVIRWRNQQNPLVNCIIPIKGLFPHRGVLSLGLPFILLALNMRLDRTNIYLAAQDGNVQFDHSKRSLLLHKANSSSLDVGTNISTFIHLQIRNPSLGNYKLFGLYANDQKAKYTLNHSHHLELLGLQVVTAFASAHNNATYNGSERFYFGFSITISIFFVIMTCLYLYIINRVMRMVVLLRASLIRQTEATRQAERKSMNKTIAFASTSHDVRTILATILGLVDYCIVDVSHDLDLHSKLTEIKSSSSKLLDMLNSVLDTSKIEVGKMHLEEKEFDLEQVLDEAVDMFHLLAFKKGVEMILDPCDGSVFKYSHLKGDHKRFHQVLCNLLSNAIKFTSSGHVLIRAWARKAGSKGSELSLKYQEKNFSFWQCHRPNKSSDMDFQYPNEDSQDQNLIEVTVEVDDTGRGIPKDKYRSVFENFVQVKELDSGNCGGVGLGLGIVQSLVRLMGGEINIVDKGSCHAGTCFRFNVFFKASDNLLQIKSEKDHEISWNIVESERSYQERSVYFNGTHSISSQIRSKVYELAYGENYETERFHAFMLIKGETRKGVVKKWMEQNKFQVHSFDRWENFCSALERLKLQTRQESSSSYDIVSNLNDCIPESSLKDKREDLITQSTTFGTYLSTFSSSRGNRVRGSFCRTASFLVIIETDFGPISELCEILRSLVQVEDFRCKVIWLSSINNFPTDVEIIKTKKAPCDLLFDKPFHGSRLRTTMNLMHDSCKTIKTHHHTVEMHRNLEDSTDKPKALTLNRVGSDATHSSNNSSLLLDDDRGPEARPMNDVKPLNGLKILVVDDNPVLLRLMTTTLIRLGACVESSNDGEVAVSLICQHLNGLNSQSKGKHIQMLEAPKEKLYDVILMDCEMPIMNGYEATRKIREEEKHHGVGHIPIIALTAHASAEEVSKSLQSGMDLHLVKPVNGDQLIVAIRKANGIANL